MLVLEDIMLGERAIRPSYPVPLADRPDETLAAW